MLVPFTEILPRPGSGQPPVGAFTSYGLETTAGVLRAAEERDAPVMLLISAQAYRSPIGRPLARALHAVADAATVPVTIQLDHVSDLSLIADALVDGVQAVMADGSKLSYKENLDLVWKARELAEQHGAHVEAELGHIAGDEERAVATASSGYTDPAEAETFAATSGASCLAVSIGNVHGRYAEPPSLDIERLREIEARTDLPLSLHGASGLPGDELGTALGGAVAKINVNTELRQHYVDVLTERLPNAQAALDLVSLESDIVASIAEIVGQMLDDFARLAGEGGEPGSPADRSR